MIETRTKYSLRCEKCDKYFLGDDGKTAEYNDCDCLTLDARRFGWLITSNIIMCFECARKIKLRGDY